MLDKKKLIQIKKRRYFINKISIILIITITILFLTPFIQPAQASTSFNVGVNKGDEFTWKTEYNNDRLEDLIFESINDNHIPYLPYPEDDFIMIMCPYNDTYWTLYNLPSFSEKTQAIKLKVTSIDEDEEIEKIHCDYFKSENRNENIWIDQKEAVNVVYKYSSGTYFNLFSEEWEEAIFYNVEVSYGGYIYAFYPMVDVELFPAGLDIGFFIDQNANFKRLSQKFNGEFRDDVREDRKVDYNQANNELHFYIDDNKYDDFETREYIVRYSDKGVLLYYEWKYDGHTLMKIELEWAFFYQYWPWIVLGFLSLAVITIIAYNAKKNNLLKR